MVELVELQALAYVAQIVGVAGTLTAAFIAVRSYLNSNKRSEEAKKKEQETRDRELETRQAQLLMQIYQTFASPQLLDAEFSLYKIEFKNSEDWKRLQGNKDDYYAFMFYGSWLEGLGVLVKNSLIDIRLLAELTSGAILFYWEKYHDGINDCRNKMNWHRFFIETEYLYDRCIEYGKAHPELKITSPRFA